MYKTSQYIPTKHHRRSIRIPEYDYSQCGMYFVTICAQNKRCIFGNINDGQMQPNSIGEAVEHFWNEIPNHFKSVTLNAFVLMPNHLHGIIDIHDSTKNNMTDRTYCRPGSLGAIVRSFKGAVTQWVRKNTRINTVWQKNYYEHVIRNEKEYQRIAEYIMHNPYGWEKDALNPKHSGESPLIIENP